MKIEKKIGWQKYEDVLQKQLESPLLDEIVMRMMPELTDAELQAMEAEGFGPVQSSAPMVPLDEKTMENIYLANNFDCWMGHTNFNISEAVKDQLCNMEGVEILKICSRYRFFLGVGRMFDFKNVRQKIEELFLLNKEQSDGKQSTDRELLE